MGEAFPGHTVSTQQSWNSNQVFSFPMPMVFTVASKCLFELAMRSPAGQQQAVEFIYNSVLSLPVPWQVYFDDKCFWNLRYVQMICYLQHTNGKFQGGVLSQACHQMLSENQNCSGYFQTELKVSSSFLPKVILMFMHLKAVLCFSQSWCSFKFMSLNWSWFL